MECALISTKISDDFSHSEREVALYRQIQFSEFLQLKGESSDLTLPFGWWPSTMSQHGLQESTVSVDFGQHAEAQSVSESLSPHSVAAQSTLALCCGSVISMLIVSVSVVFGFRS